MKILVDSNIVFSAIHNTQGQTGQSIIDSSKYFEYYPLGLLKEEIVNHKSKNIQLTKFTEVQFPEVYQLILSKILFVDDIIISDDDLLKAPGLVIEVDESDTLFVALNNYLYAKLWTGDEKLVKGFSQKNDKNTISSNKLHKIYKRLKSKKID